MSLRFVTKQMHAYLDYPVAAALIGLPFLLNLGQSNSVALWLSVITGIAALLLTLLTDHQFGMLRVLPYSFHLAVDGVVGATFVVAPLLFGFSGIDAVYYFANGLAVAIVVGLQKPENEAVHV